MRKAAAILTAFMILPGLLMGCRKQESLLGTPVQQTVVVEDTMEQTIPVSASHFRGMERYQDQVDYSDPSNWLSLPQTPEKNVPGQSESSRGQRTTSRRSGTGKSPLKRSSPGS